MVDILVQIERDKRMAEARETLLVIIQKLNCAILAFTAIKDLAPYRNDTEPIVSLFRTVFREIGN